MPMAMSGRWRMPPETSCGYCLARRYAGQAGFPRSRRVRRPRSGHDVVCEQGPPDLVAHASTGFRLPWGPGDEADADPRSPPTAGAQVGDVLAVEPMAVDTLPVPGSRPMTAAAVVGLAGAGLAEMATVWTGVDGQFAAHGVNAG